MSWRTGSDLFVEHFWPAIQSHISDRELRVDFTAQLLKLFVRNDMDPYDVEEIHPDIRAAMRRARIKITEPDRWPDEKQSGNWRRMFPRP